MLFDLAYETNVFDDYPILEHYFGNNQTILIHNLEEASMYGLKDDGFYMEFLTIISLCFISI